MKLRSKQMIMAAAVLGTCLAAGLVWKIGSGTNESVSAAVPASDAAKRVGVVYPEPVVDTSFITLPGRSRAATRATLFFRVSGPLARVHANAGDPVKKGDLLLELDDRDFKRQVAVVESGLASAKATLMKLRAGARPEDIRIIETNLTAARDDLALARKELSRYEILFKNQAVSEQAYDRAKNQEASLSARLSALEEQLVRDKGGARKEDIMAARAAVQELEARLAIARDQLADTRLTAPFSGVVTSRIPDPHEMVAQGHPVMTLDDLSRIEIPVDVPETHIRQFLDARGPKAADRFAAVFLTRNDRVFSTRLTEFSSRADQATGTYRFVFTVTPSPDDLVFPGMTAQIRLASSGENTAGTAVSIPLQSLLGAAGNTAHVFRVDPESHTLSRRNVRFETLAGGTEVRVTEGLSPGDLVVAEGAAFVRQGQKVTYELMKGAVQ
jgi:RND family efflux transporter MFP subunit